MIYKSADGKHVEIVRSHYKDDKSFYTAIIKAKGLVYTKIE